MPVQTFLVVRMWPNTPDKQISLESIDHEEVDVLIKYKDIS